MSEHDDETEQRLPNHFGAEVARRYDRESATANAHAVVDPAVALLERLAAGGSALEFAIGTGRIALPLARRGVEVHGIELSPAMVDELRAKPGGRELPVRIGDMATARVEGEFSLVYLVCNTIVNLTTQAAQVACFANAAAHLRAGGRFVVEVNVPELQRLPPGDTLRAFQADVGHWGLDEVDVVTQAMTSHHFTLVDGAIEHRPIPFRYVWPSELDLMAALAGLRLRDRCGGWSGEPFTAGSRSHVSVWESA